MSCGKRFSLLIGVVAGDTQVACPKCGSPEVNKLMSRFATARSEEDVLDDFPEPSDPDDPKAMREWMKRIGDETGEDFADEFDEYMAEQEGEEEEG